MVRTDVSPEGKVIYLESPRTEHPGLALRQ